MDINDLKRLAGVNEATVNISMTGANSAEISDLMNMFKGPEPKPMSIGGPPPPPPGLDIPDIKPPIGLDKPDAPMSLDGPLPPLPPPKPLGMDDGPAPCDTCGGIHGDEPCGEDTSWDNKPEEKYLDADHMTDTMSGGVNGRKNPKDIRVKDGSSVAESYKKDLWKALQEKYFTEKYQEKPKEVDNSEELRQQEVENYKKQVIENPIVKDVVSTKKLTIGDGDDKFILELEKPSDLVEMLTNDEAWA